mmetsp:Transcript_16123/g.50693  ORF Transcript_16123/g.50693 Transcript_16123/m.50693 type:complete len:266 (-) Transcript_16123:319-1116(-)
MRVQAARGAGVGGSLARGGISPPRGASSKIRPCCGEDGRGIEMGVFHGSGASLRGSPNPHHADAVGTQRSVSGLFTGSSGRGGLAVAKSHLAPTSQMMRKVDFESLSSAVREGRGEEVEGGAAAGADRLDGCSGKCIDELHMPVEGKVALFLSESGELVECTSRGCRPLLRTGVQAPPQLRGGPGIGHLTARQLELIRESFEEEVSRSPSDANLFRNFASFMWEGCGDAKAAKALYERAISLAPNNCPILSAYASFLWSTNLYGR